MSYRTARRKAEFHPPRKAQLKGIGLRAAAIALAMTIVASGALGATRRVDNTAITTGPGNNTNWSNGYNNLQTAISAASDGDATNSRRWRPAQSVDERIRRALALWRFGRMIALMRGRISHHACGHSTRVSLRLIYT